MRAAAGGGGGSGLLRGGLGLVLFLGVVFMGTLYSIEGIISQTAMPPRTNQITLEHKRNAIETKQIEHANSYLDAQPVRDDAVQTKQRKRTRTTKKPKEVKVKEEVVEDDDEEDIDTVNAAIAEEEEKDDEEEDAPHSEAEEDDDDEDDNAAPLLAAPVYDDVAESTDYEAVFPLLTKPMSFGDRQGYRKAHVRAREALSSAPSSSTNNPVLDLDSPGHYIPFRAQFVREEFRHLPRVMIEAEYFRFEDELGLISTEWTDEQVIAAMQRLVDVYAQGNIQIRMRVGETLARVKLSRMRALAYWFYVDYPRNPTSFLSPGRLERKLLMDSVLGAEYVTLLKQLDGERQGLFDFMMGWPEERTAWENVNVVGMYPSFYYQFMNGGGNLGCMRFRTGDCNTQRRILLTQQELERAGLPGDAPQYAKCFRFGKRSGDAPAVRSWERYNFTAEMAIRLVAHEFGHSVRLHHARVDSGSGPGDCQKVKDWAQTNLMHQVIKMAPVGHTCRVTGWPELAAKATHLTDEQVLQARSKIKFDLRQSPRVRHTQQIGPSTEVLPHTCLASSSSSSSVSGFEAVASSPVAGKVRRVRWKSATSFADGDKIRIAVGTFTSASSLVWTERAGQDQQLHALGAHVHQEQDVDLEVRVGESVVITSSAAALNLRPQAHLYANPSALGSDVVNSLPMRRREHPAINELISARDQNSLYPQVAARARAVPQQRILRSNKWTTTDECARWVFNMDVQVQQV